MSGSRRSARVRGPKALGIFAPGLLGLVLAAPASVALAASPRDYIGCDGYGAATAAGDGMTHYAMVMGIFNLPGEGTTLRGNPDPGAAGAAACDAALAELAPKHWMRRVDMLTARAVHELEAGDPDKALADLDQARAAAADRSDPYFARSLGLNIDAVRAYALRKSGKAAEGRALALQVLASRPYRHGAPPVALLDIGSPGDPALELALLRDTARLDPRQLCFVFQYAYAHRDYVQAVALYPQLILPREPDYPANMAKREADEAARTNAALFWAVRGAQHAYALAALGKDEEARDALKAARDRLAADTDADDAPSNDSYGAMLHVNTNAKINNLATPLLDQTESLIEARLTIANGSLAAAQAAMQAVKPSRDAAYVDLLLALKARQAKTGTTPPPPAVITTAPAPAGAPDTAATGLWKILPEAEAAERVPDYGSAGALQIIKAAGAGRSVSSYSDEPAEDGATTVRFRTGRGATGDMVAEIALLHAADLARQSGQKGLILVGRHDTRFTLTTTQYGRALRTDPTGFETRLDVLFVDPAAPPEPYAQWRVIDADDVYARLAPIYRLAGK